MSDAAHLASPFAFAHTGVAETVPQDSAAELASCVLNICLCEEGFRQDLPSFGAPSLLFGTVPLDLAPFQRAIERWEPRAELTLEELEELIPANRKVQVEVS
jgi:hypothetical protein